jgi:hypothetical protein
MSKRTHVKHWLARMLTYRVPSRTDAIDLRRTARQPAGHLRANYFSGGGEGPHRVSDIGIGGAFIETPPLWCTGTLMVIVFQADTSRGGTPGPSRAVQSRVVRCTKDAFAVEFIFPDAAHRRDFRQFLNGPARPVKLASKEDRVSVSR